MILLSVALGFLLILPLSRRQLQLLHASTWMQTTSRTVFFILWLTTYAIIFRSVSTRRCQLADAADRLV